jgi:hypothetical protein
MAQANTYNITTAAASRRSFLTKTASLAVAGTAAALVQPAIAADPVLALIDAHKKAVALIDTLTVEPQDDLLGAASSVEFDHLMALIEASPTTLPGIAALLTHLDWVEKKDPWKFEDNNATPLIAGLAKALNQIAA